MKFWRTSLRKEKIHLKFIYLGILYFFKKKLSTYMLLYKVKTKIHNLPRSQLKSYLDFNFGTPTVIFIAEANAIKRVL